MKVDHHFLNPFTVDKQNSHLLHTPMFLKNWQWCNKRREKKPRDKNEEKKKLSSKYLSGAWVAYKILQNEIKYLRQLICHRYQNTWMLKIDWRKTKSKLLQCFSNILYTISVAQMKLNSIVFVFRYRARKWKWKILK